jgi:hypothetical protein
MRRKCSGDHAVALWWAQKHYEERRDCYSQEEVDKYDRIALDNLKSKEYIAWAFLDHGRPVQ